MRFGLMFSFVVLPQSGGSLAEPYQDMLDCLPLAEELGYESVFLTSHHVQPDGWCPSPLVALGAAAAVTERMRLGTGVLLVPLYAPLKLAEDVAVLDNLSNGRMILGVAPGYASEEFVAHGIQRAERHVRFEEALDLMTEAWTRERFSFDGDFYHVPETSLTPRPVQKPHPSIWYGVSGPKSLRRAAGRPAVLVASPRHGIEELKHHYKVYEDALLEVGAPVPERPIAREVFVAATQEKAEQLAAPGLEHLFRELYGAKSAAGERVLRADDGTMIDDERRVDFHSFKERFIVGDPEHARTQVERYRAELGATEIICWMHLPGIRGADAVESLRLFAQEVMPAFKHGVDV